MTRTIWPMPRTIWPSGLRRWLKAPFRKGEGSNPTVVIFPTSRVRRSSSPMLLNLHVAESLPPSCPQRLDTSFYLAHICCVLFI